MISLFSPYIPQEASGEVTKILKTKWITQGPGVKEFEKEFEKLFNVKNAVAVNSGTSALETAYDLIGLKAGDEVITTPLTCTATNIPLLQRGCKIVWADVLEDTLCINPKDVDNKVSHKTKAIVKVHLGGIGARTYFYRDVPIISDSCQALGIFSGDFTCCSFQAIKHITTADGGMIMVPDGYYKNAKLMRWFGIDREREITNDWTAYKERMMSFDIEMIGYKRHMNDIAATLGLVGLRHYQEVMEHREKIFNIYRTRLKDIDGIKLVDSDVNVYWLATLLVERRDDFAKRLWEYGIETNIVQIRNDIYNIFGGIRQDLPVMNSIENKYISIPIGMHVSEENAHYICDIIKSGW